MSILFNKRITALYLLFLSCSVCAQAPHVAAGKLIYIPSFTSRYVPARAVAIWLPDTIGQSRYNVLYMHDGKALFDSTIMWNHQEWGMDETILKLQQNGQLPPTMVVGIWNGELLRHAEYMPQAPFNALSPEVQKVFLQEKRANGTIIFNEKPLADAYLKFITKELKPYIDSLYPTLSDASHTFMAGASMGGMISLYALCEYPDIFGGAACLSTHWPILYRANNNPFPSAMENYLSQHLPDPATHRIYFDHGQLTLDSLYAPFQKRVDQIVLGKGFSKINFLSLEFAGKEHSENAWRDRIAIPLNFLIRK